jgi:O-antigen biosynthesis protein WbqP
MPVTSLSWRLKRAADLLFAVIVLLAAWPLLLLLALLVRLDSAGPALFIQTRVGRNATPFRIYKFRTMHVGTPNVPTHEAAPSTVTRMGRIMRATKLDELPQLVNVLMGEMSLVGPRPCLPTQTELIDGRRSRGILDIPPGITGLAQAQGIDMSNVPRLVEADARYIATWSLAGDLRILAATVAGPRFLGPALTI